MLQRVLSIVAVILMLVSCATVFAEELMLLMMEQKYE